MTPYDAGASIPLILAGTDPMTQPSSQDSDELRADILRVDSGPPHEGDAGEGIVIHTSRGPLPGILHRGRDRNAGGILWVAGARGGYKGPADNVYGDLSEELTSRGIVSLRLNYRQPGVFPESVLDTLVGLSFLKGIGCVRTATVGHSFGGAIVIAAAALSPTASAVVSLSPQTYGAQSAGEIAPRPILVVHGLADTRLPPRCAEQIYAWAGDPKELVLYPDTEHGLRESGEELRDLLRTWIPAKLKAG